MSLQEVVTEVQRDGQARAKEVLAHAQQEADSILQAAREKSKAHERNRLTDAERDAEQLLLQARSRATSESRKIVLQAESQLRDRLRASVLEAFGGLSGSKRKAHIDGLLERARTIVPAGTVYGAAADADALKGQDAYTYGGTADISGGIIVESEDGATRLDLSYETLLDGMWRDVLRSEAKLFS